MGTVSIMVCACVSGGSPRNSRKRRSSFRKRGRRAQPPKLFCTKKVVPGISFQVRASSALFRKYFVGTCRGIGWCPLCDDVDLTAARPSHLGRIAAGLYLEFVNRIRRRAEILGIEGRFGVGDAVQQKVIGIRAVSADRDRGALPRPPVERIYIPVCAPWPMCAPGTVSTRSSSIRPFNGRS